jgi:hypothetical protein
MNPKLGKLFNVGFALLDARRVYSYCGQFVWTHESKIFQRMTRLVDLVHELIRANNGGPTIDSRK